MIYVLQRSATAVLHADPQLLATAETTAKLLGLKIRSGVWLGSKLTNKIFFGFFFRESQKPYLEKTTAINYRVKCFFLPSIGPKKGRDPTVASTGVNQNQASKQQVLLPGQQDEIKFLSFCFKKLHFLKQQQIEQIKHIL